MASIFHKNTVTDIPLWQRHTWQVQTHHWQ